MRIISLKGLPVWMNGKYKWKNRAFLMLLFVCIMTLSLVFSRNLVIVASSNEVINISDVEGESVVKIVGKLPGIDKAGKRVSLQILKIGKNFQDLHNVTPATLKDVVEIVAQTMTLDQNGSYSFETPLSGYTGTYTARVSAIGLNQVYEKEFYFVSTLDLEVAIDKFNNSTAVDGENGAKNIIEQNRQFLGLDHEIYTMYQQLQEEEKVFPIEFMMEKRKSQTFDLEQIQNAFYEGVLVNAVNLAKNPNEVLNLLEKYTDIFPITSKNAYSTFCGFKDQQKKDMVFKNLLDADFKNAEDITDRFFQEIILVSLNKIGGWGEVYKIISENNDVLELNLSRYNDLSYKINVDKKLFGTTFLDLNHIRKAFNEAVEEQEKVESAPKPVGDRTHSSGGGGQIVSGSLPRPTPQPPIVNEGTKEDTPLPLEKIYYNDLENVPWAADAINYLSKRGVLSGGAEGIFQPNEPITREAYLKMMIIAFDLIDHLASTDFSDVDSAQWFYPYVATAQTKGFINGIGDGTFGVGHEITRQDMALLSYRIGKHVGIFLDDISYEWQFNDQEQIAQYALHSVNAMYSKGVIKGMDDNMFCPESIASRAQAAVIVQRLMILGGLE